VGYCDKINPNYAQAHHNLGFLLRGQGKKDEAEEQYRLAIKADPNDAQTYYNLGILFKELGRNDEAEEQYRLAIKADPNDAQTYLQFRKSAQRARQK